MKKLLVVAAFLLFGVMYGSDVAVADIEVCHDVCVLHGDTYSVVQDTPETYLCVCNDGTEARIQKTEEDDDIYIIVPPHHYHYYPRYYPRAGHRYRHR